MRRILKNPLAAAAIMLLAVVVLAAACAPAAAPTPTPTKAAPAPTTAAAPAATPTTAAAPKVEATKPAATATTAPPKAAAKNVKVCYLSPLSGPVASLGLPQSIAAKLAEEDINKTGVNGSKWEVLTKDSPFDAQQAVTLFRQCAGGDQAFVVFGPYSSGEFDQAAPLSSDLKLPVVGTTTTKVAAAKGMPYAFRMSIPDDLSVEAAVKAYRKAYPNVKKVAIISDVKEAVVEPVTKEWFPKYLKESGFEVVGTSEFTRGMTDMSAVVTKAKGMNAEGLAVDGLPQEWTILAKELARQGLKVPTVMAAHSWPGNSVFTVKDDVEGWIAPAFFQEDLPGADVQAWVKRFHVVGDADAKIPKPVYASVDAQLYDAMMAVADIMRKAGVNGDTPLQQARDAVRTGLETLKDYKGIVRSYTMDKDLHDAAGAVYPVVAKSGRWELIK